MPQFDDNVLEKDDIEVQEPSMYKVVMINDDYTPMDFVVLILTTVFNKPVEEAASLMMEVHKNGRGVAGVYTYDIAQTKSKEAMALAKTYEYPFKVVVEEE